MRKYLIFGLMLGFGVSLQAQMDYSVVVTNVAQMVAQPINKQTGFELKGYYLSGDGGDSQVIRVIDTGTLTVDDGLVFRSTFNTNYLYVRSDITSEFNLLHFGCKGDGITDNTSRFQKALNASTNRTLVVPVGVWKLSTSVYPRSNSTIRGNSLGSVLLCSGVTNQFGLIFTNQSNIELQSLTIKGPATRGLQIQNSSDIRVRNCSFQGFVTPYVSNYSTPIYLTGNTNTLISQCSFSGNGFQGSITNTNYFNSTADIVAASGGNETGLRIENCSVNETLVNIPFQLFDVFRCSIKDCYINQGNFGTNFIGSPSLGYGNTGYGLVAYNTGSYQGNIFTVSGCVVTNTAGSGIYSVGIDNVLLENNTLDQVAKQQTNFSVPAGGIVVDLVQGAQISYNKIRGSTNNGIVFGAGVTNGMIQGNLIRDIGLSGVEIRSGSAGIENIQVQNNTISNTFSRAIYIATGTNIVISGNSLIGGNNYGIDVDTMAKGVISYNLLRECQAGIRVLAGSYNSIWGNYLNKTLGAYTGIDYRGTNSWIGVNPTYGYATLIDNTGSQNSVLNFDWTGGSGGLGINRNGNNISASFDAFYDNSFAGPLRMLKLTTAGVNTGNGPSIDLYTKDNSGNEQLGGRIAVSLQNGAAASYAADLVFWATTGAVSNEVARVKGSGIFNFSTGLTVGNTAPLNNFLIGDGTKGVYRAILASDIPSGINATKISSGLVDNTEYDYLNGLTGNIQTQLDSKGGPVVGGVVNSGSSTVFQVPTYYDLTGTNVTPKSVLGGSGITITTNSTGFTIAATGSSATAGSIIDVNTGTGGTFKVPVGSDSTGTNVVFKDILAGANITVTTNSSGFTIASTAGAGTSGTLVNSTGSGTIFQVATFKDSTGTNVIGKDILAGSGVTVTTNSSGFTIAATAVSATSGSVVDVSPASGGIFKVATGTDSTGTNIVFKDLIAGSNMTITTNSSGFTFNAAGPSGSGVSFAQPSVSIGLSVVNGSSTNAAYANAAPALSQAINPTWTADHNWSGAYVNFGNNYGFKYNSTGPKGSIMIGDATSFKPLAVGTDGQIPVADSGQTYGIRWANSFNGTSGTMINSGSSTTFYVPVYVDNTGTNLTAKPILAGSNITVTTNSSGITIASTAGGGNMTHTGTSAEFKIPVATDATGASWVSKSILAGSGITVTTNSSGFTLTGNSGTVTSVGLVLPSNEFTVTGSPVTAAGNLTGAWKTQNANTFFSGPSSGVAATPTFRALEAADMPSGSRRMFTTTINISVFVTSVPAYATIINPGDIPVGKIFIVTDAQVVSPGTVAGNGGTFGIGPTGDETRLANLTSAITTSASTRNVYHFGLQTAVDGNAPAPVTSTDTIRVKLNTTNSGNSQVVTIYLGGYLY